MKLPLKLFESRTVVHYLALCEQTLYANARAELIIMELAAGGDLDQAIIRPVPGYDGDAAMLEPMPMAAAHARLIAIQIIKGLYNLRRFEFLHRDLKGENLWFTGDGRLVIGDLGCIKHLEGKSAHCEQTVAGTSTFGNEADQAHDGYSTWNEQALYPMYACCCVRYGDV